MIGLLLGLGCLSAQAQLAQKIDFAVKDLRLPECLRELETKSGLEFAFSSNLFDTRRRSFAFRQTPVSQILESMLAGTDVSYTANGNRLVFFRSRPQRFTLSGYIEDAESGERLPGATIYDLSTSRGTVANEYGFFSLSLPTGAYRFQVQFLGYAEKALAIELTQDQSMTIELSSGQLLTEIIVTPDSLRSPFFVSDEKNPYQLSPELIRMVPGLGGVADPLQAARLLPGVQAGADGLAGLQVRGGDSGQNLMLFDGVPVYIPFHLLGLYSVYNAETVQSSQLVTGDFSARYGGATSSVFDVRTRDGHRYDWRATAGANFNQADLLVEGPIQKERSTILLAGRMSHDNFLFERLLKDLILFEADSPLKNSFFDLNVKWNYEFSTRDKLYLSLYHGQDKLRLEDREQYEDTVFESEFELNWGNTITALRWNHLFSKKLFANVTLTGSWYQYDFSTLYKASSEQYPDLSDLFFYNVRSNNRDVAVKVDWDYFPATAHQVRFGTGYAHRFFSPTISVFEEDDDSLDEQPRDGIADLKNLVESDEISAREWYAYVEDRWQWHSDWSLRAGMRSSVFASDGISYQGWEPRLGIYGRLSPKWRWSASVSRMMQPLHLLSSSSLQMPTDLWVPSGREIRPQKAWHLESGIRYQLNDFWRFQLQGYYKKQENLYVLRDTLDALSLSTAPLGDLVRDMRARTRGLELLGEYHGHRQGLTLSYAWAKSERESEENGVREVRPFAYDARHQLKLFYYHKLGRHWRASGRFSYHSPSPHRYVTEAEFGVSRVSLMPGEQLWNARTMAYHRLDVDLHYHWRGPRVAHELSLGAYNLYNQKNPAFYVFGLLEEEPTRTVNAVSFTPALQYRVRF